MTDKIKVIPNCLPKNCVVENKHTNGKTITGERIQLLYLSNLIESKGYLDVVHALSHLIRNGITDFSCHFCGIFYPQKSGKHTITAAEQEQQFLSLIKELELSEHVVYHGYVDKDQKIGILNDSHIMLLPSYYPLEGQPISLIEGMAYGLPLIATNYRGISSQIKEGVNGFFVDPKNPEDIAKKTIKLITDPDHYKEMSLNAMELFQEKYSKKAHLELLIPTIVAPELVRKR